MSTIYFFIGFVYVPNQAGNFVPTFSSLKNTHTGHG